MRLLCLVIAIRLARLAVAGLGVRACIVVNFKVLNLCFRFGREAPLPACVI